MAGKLYLVVILAWSSTAVLPAQTGWWKGNQDRVRKTQENQPHWATPLVTTNARVEQGLRADFTRQTASNGQTTWNYGGGNGLQFIPLPRTELRISQPPFFSHSDPKVLDGFGDFSVRVKERLYGSNESHHNAIVSALLLGSVPTGKQKNGSCCAVIQPSVEVGKGFHKFASTTSLAGVLPVTGAKTLGRSIILNEAFQYRTTKLVWLETEFNSTFYHGGKNDGRQQLFITPGIVVSRIPIIHGVDPERAVVALTLGIGEQIALTHFNTYNHAPVFTGRIRF